MRHTRVFVFLRAARIFVVLIGTATSAYAQLNTQHIKGVTGLKAGSQPPPHVYLIAPLFYLYNTDTVRRPDGDRVPIAADITTRAWGFGVSHVTTRKVLGGDYGYSVLFATMNNRIQGTEIDANPGGGISDTALTPLTLGWHFRSHQAAEARGKLAWRDDSALPQARLRRPPAGARSRSAPARSWSAR